MQQGEGGASNWKLKSFMPAVNLCLLLWYLRYVRLSICFSTFPSKTMWRVEKVSFQKSICITEWISQIQSTQVTFPCQYVPQKRVRKKSESLKTLFDCSSFDFIWDSNAFNSDRYDEISRNSMIVEQFMSVLLILSQKGASSERWRRNLKNVLLNSKTLNFHNTKSFQ